MQDPDPLWYDREEPPYSWKETWVELSIVGAAALTAYSLYHFAIHRISCEILQ